MQVELLQVTKSFKNRLAVDGATFGVEKGERLVVLGPSGSGKTTLLRLIAGLETPDGGSIRFDGRVASAAGEVKVSPHGRNIGMVFQDLALWPHLTVEGNIDFGLRAKKAGREERRNRVKEAVEQVHLHTAINAYPHELSGGEQQRLALARAIAPGPEVLLLDEPLANLDPDLKEEIQSLILELSSSLGVTTIHVTHDQNEALALANRLAVMHQGRIKQVGSKEEILSRPADEFVAKFLRQR